MTWNFEHFPYKIRKLAHFQKWIHIHHGKYIIGEILGQRSTYLASCKRIPLYKNLIFGQKDQSIILLGNALAPMSTFGPQSFTLDCITFDTNEIHCHGLTYITLSHVKNEEILHLFAPSIGEKFRVYVCIFINATFNINSSMAILCNIFTIV